MPRVNAVTSRLLVAVLLLLGVSTQAASAAEPVITIGPDGKSAPVFDYNEAIRERVFIPQPGIDQDADGVTDKIAIEVIRPKQSGAGMKVPAIIEPSPYLTTVCRGNETQCIGDADGDGINDKWPLFYGKYFVPRGYAYVLAESNGTANSTGCPLHGGPGDIAGEKSVVDWLNGRVPGVDAAGNPVLASWHNGSSAMIGKSYDGTLANGVAATGVQGLKTVVPISAISDWYAYSRTGGIRFNTHYPASLSSTVTDAGRRAACAPSRDAMSLQDGDATGDRNLFWENRNYLGQVSNVKAAVFATHGLQDDNVRLDHLATWWAGLGEAGVPRKLWLLREGHVDPFDSRRAAWVDTLQRWFDHWLLDVPNGIMDEPAVDIEDAKDTWNSYASWPVPGTQDTDVFLRGLTADGVGAVGLSSGGDTDALSFVDAPTQTEAQLMATPTGAQTARRVFLSAPLTQALRISGTPRIQLDATLSQAQSNLGVALVDYGPATQITRTGDGVSTSTTSSCWGQHPTAPADFSECYKEVTKPTTDVTSWRVTRGILDSANRTSLSTPADVTPGATTRFAWPLTPTDHVFAAGHQIGVVVVGDYRSYTSVVGTPGATIGVSTRTSRLTLPVVGGYRGARSAGAFAPDAVAPALTVSPDITAGTDDPGGADVAYAAPGVSDDEDPAPKAVCAPASGSRFPLGESTVTCTATDASGNKTTKAFTVTVSDTRPPVTTQPDALPAPAPPTGTSPTPTPAAPAAGPTDGATPRPPALDTVRDRTAPVLGKFTLRLRDGRARLGFSLSETARVTVSIRPRGKTTATTRREVRLFRGSRALTLPKRLRAGRYTVVVDAVDAAGNRKRTTRALTVR